MSTKNKTIGKNLRYLRKLKGIGLIEFSKMTNLGKTAISDIEKAKHANGIEHHVPLLAKALNVPEDVLTEENQTVNEGFEKLFAEIASRNFNEETSAFADYMIKLTESRGANEKYKAIKAKADIEYHKRNYSFARSLYTRNLEIATLTGDPSDLHRVHYNIASTYLMQNMYDEVESIVGEDMKGRLSPRNKADNLHLLSIAFKRRMMFDRSESCLVEAISIIESCKGPDLKFLGQCYQVLGDLYRELRLIDKSIEISSKATKICMEACDPVTELYARRSISLLFLDIKDYSSCLKQTLAIIDRFAFEAIPEKEHTINECLISICTENYDKLVLSMEYLKGFDMAPRQLAQFKEAAANLAFKAGLFEDAKDFFENAIALYKGEVKK